jgi:hypothetical protein
MTTRNFSTLFDRDGMLSEDNPLVVETRPTQVGTATLANVSDTDSSTTLAAANADRIGLIVVNDSTAILYLKYGSAATSTSCTYILGAGATWEMPHPIYVGLVAGVWASNASGAARVTELTA